MSRAGDCFGHGRSPTASPLTFLWLSHLRAEVTRLLGKELIDKACPPRKHKNQADGSAKPGRHCREGHCRHRARTMGH